MYHSSMSPSPMRGGSPPGIVPISMRIPDACRFTGISRSTLYLLIAAGEIEIIKVGRSTLVSTRSLHDLIERRSDKRVRHASATSDREFGT